MDETPTSSGQSEASSCEPSWWPPDFLEKVESVSISRQHEVLGAVRSSSWKASQSLWSTGTYSGLIPNGFYSIIPVRLLPIFYLSFSGDILKNYTIILLNL
jgi:hypothetical protein